MHMKMAASNGTSANYEIIDLRGKAGKEDEETETISSISTDIDDSMGLVREASFFFF